MPKNLNLKVSNVWGDFPQPSTLHLIKDLHFFELCLVELFFNMLIDNHIK